MDDNAKDPSTDAPTGAAEEHPPPQGSPPVVGVAQMPSTSHYPLNQSFWKSPQMTSQATMPSFPTAHAPPPYAFGDQPVFYPPPVLYQQAPAPKARKQKTATSGASSRFTKPEMDTLLDAIEEVLPIGKPNWDRVEAMFNHVYEPLGRSRLMENLRKKYHSMCKETPPTGETEMDPQVARAKAIQEDIFDKSESTIFRGDSKEKIRDNPEGFTGEEGCEVEVVDAASDLTASVAGDQSRSTKPNTLKRGIGGGPKSARVHRKSDGFIEAFVATEKAAAKRERRRDKNRNAQMQMFLSAFATAFSSGQMKFPTLNQDNSSSSSSEDDECEAEDNRQNKKARKRKTASTASTNEHTEPNSDRSELSDDDIYS